MKTAEEFLQNYLGVSGSCYRVHPLDFKSYNQFFWEKSFCWCFKTQKS